MNKDILPGKWIPPLLGLVLMFTACAPVSIESPTAMDTPVIPDTGSTPTEAATETLTEPAATATLVVTEAPALTVTATGAAGAEVIVMVNERGTPAPHLADGQGRSLYAYVNDMQNSNTSACVDDCTVEWPPLLATGSPVAGTGVDASLLSTLARDDGSRQVAYNGWPLYYYNMDTIPGTTNGQSYDGIWFLVSREGELIQQ